MTFIGWPAGMAAGVLLLTGCGLLSAMDTAAACREKEAKLADRIEVAGDKLMKSLEHDKRVSFSCDETASVDPFLIYHAPVWTSRKDVVQYLDSHGWVALDKGGRDFKSPDGNWAAISYNPDQRGELELRIVSYAQWLIYTSPKTP